MEKALHTRKLVSSFVNFDSHLILCKLCRATRRQLSRRTGPRPWPEWLPAPSSRASRRRSLPDWRWRQNRSRPTWCSRYPSAECCRLWCRDESGKEINKTKYKFSILLLNSFASLTEYMFFFVFLDKSFIGEKKLRNKNLTDFSLLQICRFKIFISQKFVWRFTL